MLQPVIIVGGGIGGLMTALSLARKGIDVELLEQAPEFKEVGAGIQLGPNVLRMLDRVDVAGTALRFASLPDNIVYRDAISGDEVTRVRYDEAFVRRYGYPYALIHRADLLDVLIGACREQPERIRLVNAAKVADFRDTGDGVEVRTEAGDTFRGAALVGCDGLHSVTRATIVGDGPARNTGQVAYRAVLPFDDVPEHLRPNDVVLWAGPRLHLAHYPLRNNTLFNMGAIFHSSGFEEGRDVYGDPDELHGMFKGVCDEVAYLVGRIETWRRWSLFDRDPIENWSQGRVTLVGDAAHPMLQYLAQGAAMAMEDAICLGDKVAGAGGDFASAFAAYSAQRYLRAGRVQVTSRYYGDLFHASGVMRTLRNQMLSGRSQEQTLKDLDWLYNGI